MEIELFALLRAAWVAATLPILVVSIPSSLLNSFHEFLLGFAKRGKIMQSSSQPLQYSSSESSNTESHGMAVCVSAFVDGRRYFTDIWHLSELSFYTAALLPLCCTFALETFVFASNRVVEFIVEGKNQIPAKEFDWWGFASPLMILRWYSWIGMAIFLWGWIHQHRCHAILGSLRKKPEQANEYVIPHGDWFDYVSSPHYLAGLVICAGLMVASGGADLTVWLIFGFVVLKHTNVILVDCSRTKTAMVEEEERGRRRLLTQIAISIADLSQISSPTWGFSDHQEEEEDGRCSWVGLRRWRWYEGGRRHRKSSCVGGKGCPKANCASGQPTKHRKLRA
ncbi:unnamed protein product [Camellia sinensis]